MNTIRDDQQFREALDALDVAQQRRVGAAFVDHVLELTDDPRVAQALASVRTGDPLEDALNAARRTLKAASLDAHTRCGSDGEWTGQAGYFVARAAEACVEPEGRSRGKGLAWKAAMGARMARVCMAVDGDEDSHDSESLAQYKILTSYLDA